MGPLRALAILSLLQSIGIGLGATVTDNELAALSEELLNLDDLNTGHLVKVELQRKYYQASPSVNPNPVFQIPSSVWNMKEYSSILKIFNTASRPAEVKFLDEVITSRVMNRTLRFLRDKGLRKDISSFKDLKDYLNKIWFTQYRRSGEVSSGFKHVFMAEPKRDSSTNSFSVNGMHNWLFFALEEAKNVVEYLGWKRKVDFTQGKVGSMISLRFRWNKMDKETGSMFVGTSPSLEMALYTVCFLARPSGRCNIQLGGQPLAIQTYPFTFNNDDLIGTAYPLI